MATLYFQGDLAGVEQHFTVGLKYFEHPTFRRSPGFTVSTFGFASLNAWTLGRADLARQRMALTIAAANANNPFDVAFFENYAAELRANLREYKEAEASVARALELSEKHEFRSLASTSKCILGWVRAELGRATEGAALIRQGITARLELGLRLRIGLFRAFLAITQERAGAMIDALATLEQAIQENSDELVYRSELLRLRGELLYKQTQIDLAEADFRQSVAVAQNIAARAWELRATTSLARLLRDTNRCDEGRGLLAKIYDWFTEGFDTADLKDAKALLQELSR